MDATRETPLIHRAVQHIRTGSLARSLSAPAAAGGWNA